MGQARRRCVAARAQAALPLAQAPRWRRLSPRLIGGRAGGDARAVRNHEWPKEVNSNLAESTDGNLSGLFLASTTLSLGKLGCWVRFLSYALRDDELLGGKIISTGYRQKI